MENYQYFWQISRVPFLVVLAITGTRFPFEPGFQLVFILWIVRWNRKGNREKGEDSHFSQNSQETSFQNHDLYPPLLRNIYVT